MCGLLGYESSFLCRSFCVGQNPGAAESEWPFPISARRNQHAAVFSLLCPEATLSDRSRSGDREAASASSTSPLPSTPLPPLSLSLCFSAPFLLFPCTFFFFSTFIIPHSVLVVSPIPDLFFSSPFVFVIIRTSSFVFVSFASFFFTFSYAPHISLGPSFFFRSYCSLGFVLRFYFCRCCRRRRCCTIRAKIFISAIFVSCFLALRSPS